MMLIYHILWVVGLLLGILKHIHCLDPRFDPSTRMKLVLIPSDAKVGSVIYRLRATDEEFDYPLQFELIGDVSSATVKIETLPCTKYNSVCQANVILQRRLEPGRYYDFQVLVRDTKGGSTTQLCSLTVTNFTTSLDSIFPQRPGIIMIPEDAKRGTELGYVVARKNPLYGKPVYLELWGSPLFAIRQKIVTPENTEGTIFLLGPLDFEKQAMYRLTILANDAYAEPGQDTRNIAGLEVVVVVQDVQDVPPIFTKAPPVTKLPAGLLPGDKILQVHAEDGDKGNPREIRYGLVSESNPFTSFFTINDTTGEIFLAKPLDEISVITHTGDPVLLTVIAEEIKVMRDEPPAMATTVQLAFFLPEPNNSPPYFENDHYISRIDENAPQGHALIFADPFVPRVYDNDSGKNGVFSLTLLNNNGTFEISPNVAERNALFMIRVRDNTLLDYEMRKYVEFQILAQELGPMTNLSASVNVTVYINDVNDNEPVFTKPEYEVELPENMTAGTKVVQVQAEDVDTGLGGRVRYTQILGYLNTSLYLDAVTGLITVSTDNHGFDREMMPEYHFYVEARDNDGAGNRAQAPLVIKIIDINDEAPIFEKSVYEFILTFDLKEFTTPAFIKAIDKDATAPNNEVRYEIINGNYANKFNLNKITGEITIKEKLILMNNTFTDQGQQQQQQQLRQRRRRKRQLNQNNAMVNKNIFILTARAYDLGVPVQFSMTTIKIHPPENQMRTVTFVVPGHNPDRKKTEETLSAITGGQVIINDIKPINIDETGIIGGNDNIKERSLVTATVLYDTNSVVDISHIQKRLQQYNSSFSIMTQEDQNQILQKAENRLLFWLLIFLALLIAITILILLFCCICSWCPLYNSASKKVININKTEDDVHLVHTDKEYGKQTKSVQVAEWMGRREAWSTDRSFDSRTKPTRWEFSRNTNYEENLRRQEAFDNNDEIMNDRRKVKSADERKIKMRNKVKDIHTIKDLNFYNSRTNLINDHDLYATDISEHQSKLFKSKNKSKHMNIGERNIDDDSIERHEIDRGSDIDYGRSSLKRNENRIKDREFYIKDGNAEILQLMTQSKKDDENLYVNIPTTRGATTHLSQPHLVMLDNSGKEILMRRFIEEQPDGKQIIREQYQIIPGATYIQSMPNEIQQTTTDIPEKSGPNSLVYSQYEPEIRVIHAQTTQQMSNVENNGGDKIQTHPDESAQLLHRELEASLKQQNALLRQILLEKEKLEERYSQKDIALETQSLPCQSTAIATQTDCEAGTQTDFSFGKMKERRRARSENDDSISEDDYEYVQYDPSIDPNGVYWVKNRKPKKKLRYRTIEKPRKRIVVVEEIKRKIRTPIKEENDDEEIIEQKKLPSSSSSAKKRPEVKTNMFHRIKNGIISPKIKLTKSPPLNKEILMEISDSLNEYDSLDVKGNRKQKLYAKEAVHYRYSEDESSDNEIIIRENNYSGSGSSSMNLDVEEVENEKHEYVSQNKRFSQKELSTEKSAPETEYERRYSLKNKGQSPISKTRLSRKDGKSSKTKEKKDDSKQRDSVSEPSVSRITKRQAPKPPSQKEERRLKEKTQSEVNLVDSLDKKSLVETSKSVPRYMNWYHSKKVHQGDHSEKSKIEDDQKSDKSKSKTSNKISDGVNEKKLKSQTSSKSSNNTIQSDDKKKKPEPTPRKSLPKSNRLLKEDIETGKNLKKGIETTSNHPLLQHSQYRYEREYEPGPDIPVVPTKVPHYMYPETPPFLSVELKKSTSKKSSIKDRESKLKSKSKSIPVSVESTQQTTMTTTTTTTQHSQPQPSKQLNVSTLEDDHDSGIVMNSLLNSMGKRNPIADKKSVFTIAYDDVNKIKKIQSGSDSPQL